MIRNKEEMYLGKLCKRNHNYNNTGFSMRRKGGACIECDFMCKREYRKIHGCHKKTILLICPVCGKDFLIGKNEIVKTKNHFCSRSCTTRHTNSHKVKGVRRSKLENWIQLELTRLYPNLEIHFNRRDAIDSEIDIYIPLFKLAIELNGPFHYEPIYGKKRLKQTQNNDERKSQACYERGIEFCIIDTSKQNYFKEKTSILFLKIITDLIDFKFKQMMSPDFSSGNT